MKNQKIIFLTLIFLTSNLFGHDPIDYINTYLPEDSLVRIIHNNEPHGTGWFGFDSSKRCACNYIQDHLQTLLTEFNKLKNYQLKKRSISFLIRAWI